MVRTIDQALHNKKRQQILDASAECFTENGFHQTGMKEIYTAAGMSAGSIYHYFENKDFIEGFIKATKRALQDTQKHVRYGRLVIEIYAESFRNDKVKNILQTLDDEAFEALKTECSNTLKLN